MEYKIAVILNNFAPQDMPFLCGIRAYQLNFIFSLSKNFLVDVYCTNTTQTSFEGINNISLINPNAPLDKAFFEAKGYDGVVDFSDNNYTSPSFLTIGLKHNYSPIFQNHLKSNFINKIFSYFKKSKNDHKITTFAEKMATFDILFLSSQNLKKDYIQNTTLQEENIIILNPCLTTLKDFNIKNLGNTPFTFAIDFRNISYFKKLNFMFAIAKLKKEQYDFKIKIINPNYKKDILMKTLLFFGLSQNIEFVGYQDKMNIFWEEINCFINLNTSPFNFSVLEAMNSSIPCISNDIDGTSDIIKENENGWLLQQKHLNTQSLYTKMKFILNNQKDYPKISENAYKTACKLSLENHSSKLFEILKIKIESNKNQDCENNP